MKKMISRITLVLVLMITCLSASAQEVADSVPQPVSEEYKDQVIRQLADKYADWSTCSMSGKLSGAMLPMTASVKIYMEKDSLVIITISAPLIGEAGRIEIDRDEVLAVNKVNNTFTTLEMAEIARIMPGGLPAIQNLLLGRILVLGTDGFTTDDAESLQFLDLDDSTLMIVPEKASLVSDFIYYFLIGKSDLLLSQFAVIGMDEDWQVVCDYQYDAKGGVTINSEAAMGQAVMAATLKLNQPDLKTKEIKRIELNSRYRNTDLKGLMRF